MGTAVGSFQNDIVWNGASIVPVTAARLSRKIESHGEFEGRILIGVTASRFLRYNMMHFALSALSRFVENQPLPVTLVNGGCVGGDALFARATWILRRRYDSLRSHAVLPSDRRHIDKDWDLFNDTYEEVEGGYRARDTQVVRIADWVLGVPVWPESHPQSSRSGTWMTIRIARKLHKPTNVYVANEGRWLQ